MCNNDLEGILQPFLQVAQENGVTLMYKLLLCVGRVENPFKFFVDKSFRISRNCCSCCDINVNNG